MPINFNGTNIDKIIYNGKILDKVIFNGVVVWEGIKPLVMDATGIEEAIRIIFTNPNNYEANVTVYLDYDFSQEWNVKVPANGKNELVISNLLAGDYEVLAGYSINGKSFEDYAQVQVSKMPFQKVVTSVYTKPNIIGFALNNKNSFEVNCIIFIDGSWKGLYIAKPGEKYSYDISIPEKAGRVVKYEVSYGKADGSETFTDKTTGSIYIETDETTTTTTYALGEPTSTEGNFKYYQGGKNARPINK